MELTFTSLLAMMATIVCGGVIFGATFIAANAIAFWFVDSREAANAFTYGGRTTSQYPLDILSIWFRRFFVWIVPVGFVAWLPGTRILDDQRPIGGLPTQLSFLPPVAAGAAAAIAAIIWRQGMRRYESTGS